MKKKGSFGSFLSKSAHVTSQAELDTYFAQQEIVRRMRPINMFRKI